MTVPEDETEPEATPVVPPPIDVAPSATGVVVGAVDVGAVDAGAVDAGADAREVIANPGGHTDAGGVLIGTPQARRHVIIYEDPQCPYCREFEERCGDMLRREIAAGAISVEYRMRSLLGPGSVRAGNALALAAEAGRFDHLLFAMLAFQPSVGPEGYTVQDLLEIGRRADLTNPDYAEGVRDGRYLKWVEQSDLSFESDDPEGTPAVRLDGRPLAPEVLDDCDALGGLLRA